MIETRCTKIVLGTNRKISGWKQFSCDSKSKAKTYLQWSSFEARQLSSLLDRWCWSWLQNTFRNEINDSLYESGRSLNGHHNGRSLIHESCCVIHAPWCLIRWKWTIVQPEWPAYSMQMTIPFHLNHPFSDKVSAVALASTPRTVQFGPYLYSREFHHEIIYFFVELKKLCRFRTRYSVPPSELNHLNPSRLSRICIKRMKNSKSSSSSVQVNNSKLKTWKFRYFILWIFGNSLISKSGRYSKSARI